MTVVRYLACATSLRGESRGCRRYLYSLLYHGTCSMSVISQGEPLPTPETHHWTYEKVRTCIGTGPFMIGAPSWGCETHHSNDRSVPCYRELHGCTLTCPRCPQRCQWTHYVPLIDCRDAKLPRIVHTGGTKTRADTINLSVGTLVRLTRGPHQTDTLRVSLWPTDLSTALAPVARARCMDDITPYLLHLWQMRELTEHFGQRFYRARGRRVRDTPPGRSLPRPISSAAAEISLKLAEGMRPE